MNTGLARSEANGWQGSYSPHRIFLLRASHHDLSAFIATKLAAVINLTSKLPFKHWCGLGIASGEGQAFSRTFASVWPPIHYCVDRFCGAHSRAILMLRHYDGARADHH